ncbi:nicotinate-nucleotide--dimethylbenzimidazole phosphoribosyltransferase [Streptomyces sp. LE64]|uniref:nicotinate-nucleotide--dimethylbenzimidazole phosphoribosyltransferase n=1 Tax=Streptomyces sp. LE64 TaxID=3448653 RepID=UPI004041EB55
MTDTGRTSDEAQPDHPGEGTVAASVRSGTAPPPGPAETHDDDQLLMPGSQGAWSDGRGVPSARATAPAGDAYPPVVHTTGATPPPPTGSPVAPSGSAARPRPTVPAGPAPVLSVPTSLETPDDDEPPNPYEADAPVTANTSAPTPQPHPAAPAPVEPAAGALAGAHEPGPHETGGRDSGPAPAAEGADVRAPGAHPAPGQPTGTPRRPLHAAPPTPDTASGPVRSLADRGPAGSRRGAVKVRRQPAPSAAPEQPPAAAPFPGPQLAEIPPQAGAPWGAPPAQVAPSAAPETAPAFPPAPEATTTVPTMDGTQVPASSTDTGAVPVPPAEQPVAEAPSEAVPQPSAPTAPPTAGRGVPLAPPVTPAPDAALAAVARATGSVTVPHTPPAGVAVPVGEFVPVEGSVPTTPHLAPTPSHPLTLPHPQPEPVAAAAPVEAPAGPAPAPAPVAPVEPGPTGTPEPATTTPAPTPVVQAAPAEAPPAPAAPEQPPAPEAPVAEATVEAVPEPAAEAPAAEATPAVATPETPEPVAVEPVPALPEPPVEAEPAPVTAVPPAAEAPAAAPTEEQPAPEPVEAPRPVPVAERPAEPQPAVAEPVTEVPAPVSGEADEAPVVPPATPEGPPQEEAPAAPPATDEAPAAEQPAPVEDQPQPAPVPAAAEAVAEPAAAEPAAVVTGTPEPAPVHAEDDEAPEAVAQPQTAPADEAAVATPADEPPAAEAADPEAEAPAQTPDGLPTHSGDDEPAAAPEATEAVTVTVGVPPVQAAAPAPEPTGPAGETPVEPAARPPAPRPEAPAPGYEDAEREAVLRVMRERRDIRNGFRPDPIPHEVLLRVLEAAHTAPSVGHSQPWDFVVIRSEETRRTMHELAERQRDAYARTLPKGRAKQFKELKIEAILDTPVNIVVTADPTRGGRHTLGRHTQPQMAPYSSALAVENLWLAARAEGLGVGWVSFFDEREMVRALDLPEHLEVVAYLCVGYVDEFPEDPELVQAGWSQRRPLAWVVHEETYGRRVLPGAEPHDLLTETVAGIRPLDAKALGEAWERQKRMTKPAGALGMLEILSAQLCGLSRTCPPPIPEPAAVAIFAGDHGVHAQGVTPWPQEVTGQMVANFLNGGAVCNAFAKQVGAEVCVVDVGVAADLPTTPGLLPRKVRAGTADMTAGPALTREEVTAAIEVGIETARDLVAAGNKALLTGEMGIANTTASAALIAVYTGIDPAEITGRGTGINDETLARKTEVVRRALALHRPDPADPIGVLAAIGGLEHAAMVGLVLGGASLRTPVILDGVSAGAAALVARAVAPESLSACIAGHRSAEPGHVAALNKLGLRPLVELDLRLGEGTGALLALPLVQSAARVMHEVATFDAAGVTEK